MQYWRMQLHPSDPSVAMHYAVQSIGAGFIGLDFAGDIGDLRTVQRTGLPAGQTDYWDFAHKMNKGDKVLVIVHHFPFALVTVSGDYNYIARTEPEMGVWFRHFRRIETGKDKVRYFADRMTDVRKWDQLKMTDTISLASGYKSKNCNWLHVDSLGNCDFAGVNACESSIF
jgi:hypothetical protein